MRYNSKAEKIERTKILFDECVSIKYYDKLSTMLNKKEYLIEHVANKKTLKGSRDSKIAIYLRKNDFDIFITCDMGFCWRIIEKKKGFDAGNIKVISVSPIEKATDKHIEEVLEYILI